MKKILFIALKDLKLRARDPSAFIILLVLPLLLILVLGMVFKPMWTSAPFTINVEVLNNDSGDLSKILVNDVFGSSDMKDMIKVYSASSEAQVRDDINNGRVAAGVIIPSGFSEAVYNGKDAKIDVLADPVQTIKAGVVKSIVESYTLEILKRQTVIHTFLGVIAPDSSINPAEIQKLIPTWLDEIGKENNLVLVSTSTEKRYTSDIIPMDYYAFGMAIMFLFFATNAGAETIFEERRIRTFDRIRTFPVSNSMILGGKILGISLIALVQFLIILFFTALVYRVNWGDSIPGIIVLMFSSVLAFSGLSTLFASITKSENQIGNIGPALAMIFGFIGGGMFPTFAFPQWLNIASRFTPNRWTIDGFVKLTNQGGTFISILPQCGMLILMAGVFFVIGVLRLREV
jgi:ABC-2 type transport system permease protein